MCDIRKQTFLDREESVQVLKTWNNFSPDTLNCLSNRSELNCDCVLRRSVGCSTTLLQEAPPPPMGSPGGSCPLMHEVWKGSRVQLTPEMVRAEFLSGKALVLGSNFTREMTPRHQGELQKGARHVEISRA
ncbi:cilia- and flagella-associated protein 221 [Notolabrus celidotus]|uniref:cilia- and flagella-associated protein 221 n=1 Tax=Notolabrus celidotus TaxID=1203425 RepID=UPI00148FF61E|nr:cilia- and flagella-associated protein 221 [Notolabrus celidotus]